MKTNFSPQIERMPCAFTQGYALDCRDNAGGAVALWIIEHGSVSGVTSASGIVSAITKTTGKRFWKYNQIRGNMEAKEEIESNQANGVVVFNQTINIVLTKMQASIRNEVLLLAQNNIVSVVQDRNGKYWLYGWTDPLVLSEGTIGTGKAGTDLNGYALTFTSQQAAPALEVSSSVITALETPA